MADGSNSNRVLAAFPLREETPLKWRLELDCGHSVIRTEPKSFARCDQRCARATRDFTGTQRRQRIGGNSEQRTGK
jgi:hypothetical protein